jgi:glucosamine-6-phosphate isomerase
MFIKVFDDYQTMSQNAGELLIKTIRTKPDAVVCLASGETPVGAYQHFTDYALSHGLDLSGVTFIGLDEWIGIAPDNPGSCRFFLDKWVFLPLGINPDKIHLFDGMTTDEQLECRRMNTRIAREGGIDLMILGIGLNGHIGLNEPGVSHGLYAHVMDLSPTTVRTGQKYFQQSMRLTKGITIGIRHVMESKNVLLIANGQRKAAVIRDCIEGPETNEIPATILRHHANAFAYFDKDAASLLTRV